MALAIAIGSTYAPGGTDDIDVTGGADTSGAGVSWSSSLGSTFSPNPSTAANGATTYTASSTAGTDTITATDASGNTATATTTVAVGGGSTAPTGYTISAAGAQAASAAFAALSSVSDFTQQAACAPVQAAQTAWNSNGGTPALTVDGGYGADTAAAWAAVAKQTGGGNVPAGLTSGFPTCSGTPSQPVQPVTPTTPATTSSGSKVWWWIAGIIIAAGVGGLLYWVFGTESGKQTFAGEKKRKKKRKKK